MRTIVAAVLLVSLPSAVGAVAEECPKNTAETTQRVTECSRQCTCAAHQPCSDSGENGCLHETCDVGTGDCGCLQPTKTTAGLPSPETLVHLAKAQEHLRAAGLYQLAAQLDAHRQRLALTQQLAEKVRALAKLQDEITQLRAEIGGAKIHQTATPQVAVQLKIVEVSRGKLDKLGLDKTASKSAQAACAECAASGAPGGQHRVVAENVDDVETLAGGLESLCSRGLAKVLAEPCVITLSGRPVTFSSGGEVPVPVPTKDNKVAVELLHFGTQVDLVPVVLDNGQIRLELRAEVKQLDETATSHVGGQSIPAIRAGRVDTAVNVASGHTVAVAGLVHAQRTRSCPAACSAGNKPAEPQVVELIVLATPRIVGMPGNHVAAPSSTSISPHVLPSPPVANAGGDDSASRR